MCITDRNSNTKTIGERWHVTSRGIRRALAGIRDPRLRADIQRLIDDYLTGTGTVPAPTTVPGERAEALAAICEALLRQFDDDQAGAAEIRLVVHKRDELPTRPASGPHPDSSSAEDGEHEEELVWELRRLLASSGGTIADVAHALERRGDEVDRLGRALLEDEVHAVEVDIAILKTHLSDPVDWDAECKRLLAGELPPFGDRLDDDDDAEDDPPGPALP